MRRRNFLKFSGLILLSGCFDKKNSGLSYSYPIHVHSDMAAGHHLMNSGEYPKIKMPPQKTFIVGGGIAGITAAYQLRKEDFVLCELSESLGGSSGGINYKGLKLCQGAHYDLNYPNYFGEEVIAFMEELGIVQFNKFSNYWDFKDKQFLIDQEREGQSLISGVYQEDVLYGLQQAEDFLEIMQKYQSKLMLPTRLIHSDLYHLNALTLEQFLRTHLKPSDSLIRAINYQMKDDFGGTYSQVSALAGLYYYAARPYWDSDVHIFSPPQGNYYFIEKMLTQIPLAPILTGHLVKKIVKSGNLFKVEVIAIQEKKIKEFTVNRIIYAGQKHALQYTYSDDYALFSHTQYAPWVVINFILKEQMSEDVYWQNEFLRENTHFLGFVDSQAQFQNSTKKQVLTAYYCFEPKDRATLKILQNTPEKLVHEAVHLISEYFQKDQAWMNSLIERVFIKFMGHAMPVPGINYLLNDKNKHRSVPHLVYAGVDNSRLPLFLEAVDSGLEAVRVLKQLDEKA
ncbi:MAG: FAD/NAD(P)-binding protein [Microscillaceae bacterium]|nr:FAD/NAD(P)-binding protein [Microscillaceae bacterium]